MVQFTIQNGPATVAVTASSPGGARETFAHRLSGSPYDPYVTALGDAAQRVSNEVEAVRSDYTPDALVRHARKSITRHFRSPFTALQNAIQANRRNHADRTANLIGQPADAGLAAEDRADFRSVSPAQRYEWIVSADRAALAAVVSVGRQRWPNIDDGAWLAACNRLMLLVHIEQAGIVARFPKPATPDNPAPTGPDMQAVEAFAQEAVARFNAEIADADSAEAVLSRAIAVVAVSADISVQDAFSLLTGAGEV